MRQTLAPEIEKQRVSHPALGTGPYGAFNLWCPVLDRPLHVIAFDGRAEEACQKTLEGVPHDPDSELTRLLRQWEHVSVSGNRFCPNWAEMCWVKDVFWEDEECVVQYHPPKSDHINVHPFVLHLWRPIPGLVLMNKLLEDVDGITFDGGDYLMLADVPRPPHRGVGMKPEEMNSETAARLAKRRDANLPGFRIPGVPDQAPPPSPQG